MRRDDVDNDLVKIDSSVLEAGGEIVHLTGIVRDTAGAPRDSLRVEIWQCDSNGKYLHPGDRQQLAHDGGFQGFGHDITSDGGRFRFRTIKPVAYPGRAPHIHVKIREGDDELLTTQFYLADHPDNVRDGLFQRMSADEAAAVSMTLDDGPSGWEARVNMVV